MVDHVMVMAIVMLVNSATLFVVFFCHDIFLNEEPTTRLGVSALFALMAFINICIVGQ